MFGDIITDRAGKSFLLGLLAAPAFANPEQSERSHILRVVIIGTVLVTVCLGTPIMILQPATASRGSTTAVPGCE